MHTMTSLHKNIPTAPPRLMMHTANITSSNTIAAKIINNIITITLLSSTIESVNNANYMNLLSKQVSHRSLGIGFIFRAHMICRTVTVGYNPLMDLSERVLKKSMNLGCK